MNACATLIFCINTNRFSYIPWSLNASGCCELEVLTSCIKCSIQSCQSAVGAAAGSQRSCRKTHPEHGHDRTDGSIEGDRWGQREQLATKYNTVFEQHHIINKSNNETK